MTNDWKQCVYLMRLDKPIGILLLLWPTLWALWLASFGKPSYTIVAIFIVGVVVMRSAGCIINDFMDRHFDAKVARTHERPLAAGTMKKSTAILLFSSLCLLAFVLVLFLNAFTLLLAIVGLLLVLIYPLLKRVTNLSQLGLGVAFSWGIPMAFAATRNDIPPAAWLLFFTAALWPVMYDTMYAMADRNEDMRVGIKSTAILFGSKDTLMIAVLQVIFLMLMGWVGLLFNLNVYFYLSLLVAEGFFAYEQFLIKDNDPQRCIKAFINNHWVGLTIFIGIWVGLMQADGWKLVSAGQV